VCITTRRGRTWTYRKDRSGWTQTGPTGRVRRLTAEQLLSHILPPLAAGAWSPVQLRVKRNAARRSGRSEKQKAGEKQSRRAQARALS
jgi:hypothetical protein